MKGATLVVVLALVAAAVYLFTRGKTTAPKPVAVAASGSSVPLASALAANPGSTPLAVAATAQAGASIFSSIADMLSGSSDSSVSS